MKIIVCKTAGLCAGAKRAYDEAVKSAKIGDKKTCVYKEILHNEKLLCDLESKGVKTIYDLNDISPDSRIILRAHGEEKQTYDMLKNFNAEIVDMICPNVKKVHDIAIKKEDEGCKIIVVGNIKNGKIHDETKSLLSFLTEPIFISSVNDVHKNMFENGKKYFAVCQTTFSLEGYKDIVELLGDQIEKADAEFDFANTICNFPLVNMKESVELAKKCDCVIVLGSKSSSNTTQLYNSVKNVCPTIFDDDFETIKNFVKNEAGFLHKNDKDFVVGIVAGASTLKTDIDELSGFLLKPSQ